LGKSPRIYKVVGSVKRKVFCSGLVLSPKVRLASVARFHHTSIRSQGDHDGFF
jgi:hypothetical protein